MQAHVRPGQLTPVSPGVITDPERRQALLDSAGVGAIVSLFKRLEAQAATCASSGRTASRSPCSSSSSSIASSLADMSDHHSSEATLIDFGGAYRVEWQAQAQAPVSRSTARMTVPARMTAPVAPQLMAPPLAQGFWCKLDPRLVMLSEPDSARAAGFRLLRDGLLAKGLPRVLAVSSPAAGDGKTTCAANLTFALAEQTSARLLLLDANFFAPALASMFSIDEYAPPAAPYCRSWSSPFKLTALTPRLDLATIVLTRGEPLPRLDHEAFVRLLGSFFRAGYDRIILDAPALEGSPVVSRLLDVADGVVLAVRAGHTTERALRRAVNQVGPSKMMGAALMDSRLDSR